MLPVVIRSAEVILLLVPAALRESALALGAPRWKVIFRIVLPTALPGMVTGVLLAVARAAGETAPLLFTAASTHERPTSTSGQFMNSLPVQIYNDVTSPTTAVVNRAWGAALTLVVHDPAAQPDRSPGLAKEPPCMNPTDPPQHVDRHGSRQQPETASAHQTRRRAPSRRAQPTARLAARPHATRRPAQAGLERDARAAARLLRRRRTGQGHRPRLPRQRGDRDHRPLGLRQVDDGALHQPHARGDPRRARRGPGAARRRSTSTTRRVDVVAVRRAIGMVFQKPNPFPTMSVFDNVAAGLRLTARGAAGDLHAKVEAALRGAGLWDEVADRLSEPGAGLSGGQQQRLCIARSLAVEPEVILMDEPCSALDPIATLKIEELIDELKQRVTIVIVTHNMQQAARVADRTAFMLGGELVEVGPTQEIFTNPDDSRTEEYVTGKFG